MVQVVRGTAPLPPTNGTQRPPSSTPQAPAAKPAAGPGPAATYKAGAQHGKAEFDPTSELCSMDNPKACTDQSSKAPHNFFINGIRTSEASARSNTELISHNLGEPVEMIYNPTHGAVADAAEALQNIVGADTKISRETQGKLRKALDSGEKVRIFAHSQGAAITGDALHKLAAQYKAEGKTPAQVKELMSKVEVISFGGFSDKESFPPGVKLSQNRDPGDHIPQLGTACQTIGKSYQQACAEPKKVGNWARLAGSVGNGLLTVGKTIVNNGAEAVKSAYDHRDQLDKALGHGRVFAALGKGDLEAAGKCVNQADLNAYCAQIGTDVTAEHLTVVVRNNRESGYLTDYFRGKKPEQPVA